MGKAWNRNEERGPAGRGRVRERNERGRGRKRRGGEEKLRPTLVYKCRRL